MNTTISNVSMKALATRGTFKTPCSSNINGEIGVQTFDCWVRRIPLRRRRSKLLLSLPKY